MQKLASKIFNSFFPDKDVVNIVRYGNGHINDTYLINSRSEKYILQRINVNVFITENLVSNFEYLIGEIEKNSLQGNFFPMPYRSEKGEIHIIDESGHAWRVFSFLENAKSLSISPNTDISTLAGAAMGQFQSFLNQLDAKCFKDTILNFHNPQNRFRDYKYALQKSSNKLRIQAQEEINLASEYSFIVDEITSLIIKNNIPVRITHNDPKLENVLFGDDINSSYVIDLDTIMKGSIGFDFGDMVRSICSLSAEDEVDLSKVIFSLEHFSALCNGYFCELKSSITDDEKKSIYPSIMSIVYVQGIRFLTDFLAGNIYYKTDYENHNLIRCKTQFKLLKEIISSKKEILNTINTVLG